MRIRLLNKFWELCFLKLGRYRVDGSPIRGSCDPPDAKNKKILIDETLHGKELLEVLLHEMGHACDWPRSEEYITQQAEDMANVLWRLGYRRISEISDISLDNQQDKSP